MKNNSKKIYSLAFVFTLLLKRCVNEAEIFASSLDSFPSEFTITPLFSTAISLVMRSLLNLTDPDNFVLSEN